MYFALTFKHHMFSIIMFLWVVIRVSRSQTHESRQTHLLHLSNQTHLFVISSSLLSISAPPCSALQLLPNLVYVLVSLKHSNCLMFLSCTSMQARTKARYVFSANGKCSQCAAGVQLFQTLHIMRQDLWDTMTGLSRRRQQILWQESTSLFPVKVDVCCRNPWMKPHKQFGDLCFWLCFVFILCWMYIKSLHRRICSICGAAEWLRGGQQRLHRYIDESSACEQSWRRLKHQAWFVHYLLEYFSFWHSTFFSTMRLMIGYPLHLKYPDCRCAWSQNVLTFFIFFPYGDKNGRRELKAARC